MLSQDRTHCNHSVQVWVVHVHKGSPTAPCMLKQNGGLLLLPSYLQSPNAGPSLVKHGPDGINELTRALQTCLHSQKSTSGLNVQINFVLKDRLQYSQKNLLPGSSVCARQIISQGMILLVQYKCNIVSMCSNCQVLFKTILLLLVLYISNPNIHLYSSCSLILHELPGSSHGAGAKEALSYATSIWAKQR